MAIAGASINGNIDLTTNTTEITQIQTNRIMNNSELYNEIKTSYEKAFEVVNKVRNEINMANEAMAKAETTQSNKVGKIDLSNMTNSNISISQKNKAEQNVSLIASVQALTDLEATNTQKAIIADMVGLTQSADNKQTADNTGTQDSSAVNDTLNKTDQKASFTFLPSFTNQYLEKFGLRKTFSSGYKMKKEGFNLLKKYVFRETALFGANINIDVSNTVNDNKMYQSVENWNETNTKNTNIQEYASSLTEKTENVDENIQNLQNNMAAAAEASQSNELEELIGDGASGINYNLEQSNELSQAVTQEYGNFMETVKKTMNDSSLDSTSTSDIGQTTTNDQTSKNTSDQTAKVDNKTTNESSQSAGSASIIMIIVIVIVLVVVVGMFAKGFSSKEAFYDDPNFNENTKQNSISNNIANAMPPPTTVPGVRSAVPNTQPVSVASKPPMNTSAMSKQAASKVVKMSPIKKLKGGMRFEPERNYIF